MDKELDGLATYYLEKINAEPDKHRVAKYLTGFYSEASKTRFNGEYIKFFHMLIDLYGKTATFYAVLDMVSSPTIKHDNNPYAFLNAVCKRKLERAVDNVTLINIGEIASKVEEVKKKPPEIRSSFDE